MPVIVLHLQKQMTHTHSAQREHEIKDVHDSLNISKILFFYRSLLVCIILSDTCISHITECCYRQGEKLNYLMMVISCLTNYLAGNLLLFTLFPFISVSLSLQWWMPLNVY